MKVILRQRKQTIKGGISLYLEIYKGTTKTPEGKTKVLRDYKYLDLYLIDNPKSPVDRQTNKDNLKLAESIKAKTELEIKNGQYGFKSEFKGKANFIEYFQKLTDNRKDSKGNHDNWHSTLKKLIKFAGNDITFNDIDIDFVERFKDYLLNEIDPQKEKALSKNAALSYFNKFKAALNKAFDDRIIIDNPAKRVKGIKAEDSKREYLTLDELKRLVKKDCRYPVLKNAFLFSCLTGLRWSDVQKLTWSEVQKENEGYRITFFQKKTKGLQYLDISEQARAYLGEQGKSNDKVFKGLKYSDYMNVALAKWVMTAKITKDITFHCARHTFAVLQLTLGTEIYTLSKLLGHSDLRTTQIYAKIIDEKKREAVNKIPAINI